MGNSITNFDFVSLILRPVRSVLYGHKDAPSHLVNTRRQPQTRDTSKNYKPV